MRIDTSHKNWAKCTLGALAIATSAYLLYRPSFFSGPFGGTPAGLIFGGFGAAAMLWAFALNLRKLLPVWRRGPAGWWMRGHLWLGFLSYPLILFHSGFKAGGFLTCVLMWIFPFVIFTGILGALLQHFIPKMMSETIDEGIYSQIGYLQNKLTTDAENLLKSLTNTETENDEDDDPAGSGTRTAVIAKTRVSANQVCQLAEWYEKIIKPYLMNYSRGIPVSRFRRWYEKTIKLFTNSDKPEVDLNPTHTSEILFRSWRNRLPELETIIDKLEQICHEKRELDRQKRMHSYLHSWLVVHVPLSILLIVLGTVHAVMAFHYWK